MYQAILAHVESQQALMGVVSQLANLRDTVIIVHSCTLQGDNYGNVKYPAKPKPTEEPLYSNTAGQ